MPENVNYQFLEAYSMLNPAQKKAADTTEGPVLVVAGPGTGKTQILAARIGNILAKENSAAENILCLTYTEAGVTAMRKRLIKFIGAEAYKVGIFTFHGFCNKVIQENPNDFGFAEMESISELEEITLLEKLIDGFDDKNVLKRWRGKIYYDAKNLKSLFSLMKRENITVEKLEKAIEHYLTEIYPTEKGVIAGRKTTGKDGVVYQKGDLRLDKIEAERKKFDKTIAAAKEFEKYQQLKINKERYDYDDMIHNVLQAFQTNDLLLGKYQEQYHYFLVDEYQDTNGAQNEILQLLYSYWESPNVFVVGDDDQSIYRFQGASLENIIGFYNNALSHLPIEEQQERIIILKNNYRSTQAILDVVATSIDNNQERLVNQIKTLSLDKNLTSSGDISQVATIAPTIVEYPNPAHEIADIVNQIETLKNQGVKLSEIGVLYREHKMAAELEQCLNQKEIPINTSRSVNILNEPLTEMLLSILTYIIGESKIAHSREDLLFEMMMYPFFEIEPLQAARLSFELRESRFSEPKTTWREALENIEKIIDEKSHERLLTLAKLTSKWQKDLVLQPFPLLFQTILDDVDCMAYIRNHEEKVWLLQELKTLFDFIKQESQKKPTLTVPEFLEMVEQMNEYNISIPFVKSTYAQEAVQLSTLHGSKGLEYEYVFMLSCNSKKWEAKSKRSLGFKLPVGLLDTTAKEVIVEDSRRLFFVGMTRAKRVLQISYSRADWSEKEQTPSLFVTEIEAHSAIKKEERHLDDEAIFEYTILQLQKEINYPALLEQNLLKSRLENYTLSLTHLNNYLECPLKFYFENFIQIPSAKNEHMAFGSAVHDSIEMVFKIVAESGNYPSTEEIEEICARYMYKQQDSFTKKQYDQKLDYIKHFLPLYVDYYKNEWNQKVLMEERVESNFNGLKLRGFIDKIEIEKTGVTIVDYKTGNFKYKKGKQIFEKPLTVEELQKREEKGHATTHEHIYGGNYWRQAIFYKVLLDNSSKIYQRDWHLEGAIFDFVEPEQDSGDFFKQKIVVDPISVNLVQKQITDTWQNIQDLKFDGCGKEDCQYCNFEETKKR